MINYDKNNCFRTIRVTNQPNNPSNYKKNNNLCDFLEFWEHYVPDISTPL